jgi:RNA polymerase sigma factor (sigma-70 family)
MARLTRERLVSMVTDEIALMLGRGDLSAQQEDELLSCLEKAYRHLGQLRSHSRSAVRSWLYMILRNLRADGALHQRRWPAILLVGDLDRIIHEPICEACDPLLLALDAEKRHRIAQVRVMLEQVLDGLEPERARLFRSRFFDQVPAAQLAAELHISPQAVAMRYQRLRHRVLRQLTRLLHEQAPDIVEYFQGSSVPEHDAADPH